ncbi:MAG TPA: P-II family nitrogen regulator [Syntrophorhabdaceae bacterium]|nr:P-II family nitrogen regulator [Syntrophorhabdaceae bacterium]
MANQQVKEGAILPKLGLTGATMNAAALIAPGAFLWITYQLQAAATTPNGASAASDIWMGIVLALFVAFLTALSYAQLAKIYPEAGFASCAYFAEKAWLDAKSEKRSGPKSMARISKLATGWSAHLFYWAYSGVMAAMMATLIAYIYNQFTGADLSITNQAIICVVFTIVTGYIAYRGVTGSTMTSIGINIIQWATLIVFSGLAIWYRIANPQHVTQWAFSGGLDIIKPHALTGIVVQSTIAILILVGFESCTALSAETKNAGKTIPKAIIISLLIQGVFAYLIEYFAGSYMISDKLVNVAGKVTSTGMAAAAASSAPLGDLVKLLGDSIVPGIGFGLMITMAVTVAIAILGTTLSAMNTAMRISAGMADDRELPSGLSFIHPEFRTPHMALVALIIAVSVIGVIGVQSVVGLTGIALASNLGTFILYGLTCVWTIIAFKGRPDFSALKHALIPTLGVMVNALMVVAILYLYTTGNADAKAEAKICFMLAGGWAIIAAIYVAMTTVRKTYRFKMVSGMIRPEQLNIVVDALKEEDYIMGMTVTKVKGFGRQKGNTNGGADGEQITFVPKIKVDVLVREWDVQAVMDIIGEAARTGNVGDGKIFVVDASEAMRIRTGERGIEAI